MRLSRENNTFESYMKKTTVEVEEIQEDAVKKNQKKHLKPEHPQQNY